MSNTLATEMASVKAFGRKCPASASILPMKSGGNFMLRPKKSLICVLRMMIAMPLVKPVTTG